MKRQKHLLMKKVLRKKQNNKIVYFIKKATQLGGLFVWYNLALTDNT